MKKNILFVLTMLLLGVNTAWADDPTTLVFQVTSTTINSNYPFVYTGDPFTYIESFTVNCNAGGGAISGNTGTNAGNYTATITSNCYGHPYNNTYEEFHVGSFNYNWEILPRDISKTSGYTDGLYVDIALTSEYVYTGSDITVGYTVTFNSTTLTLGTDYDIIITPDGGSTTLGNVKNAGDYTITFIGKGNFTGTVSKTFKVLPRDISKNDYADSKNVVIKVPTVIYWSGNVIDITDGTSYDKVSGDDYSATFIDTSSSPSTTIQTLIKGTDYDINIIPDGGTDDVTTVKNTGKYTVTFTGKGNFTGTVVRNFEVKKEITPSDAHSITAKYEIPVQIRKATSNDAYTFTYAANTANNFQMVVKDGTRTLVEGTDYTLQFSANGTDGWESRTPGISTNEGKYFVRVIGAGTEYQGTSAAMAFYVLNEYKKGGEGDIVTLHITEPGYPTTMSPSGAIEKGEMMVGAFSGPAVAIDTKTVTLKNSQTYLTDVIFNVVGIEDKAFHGCSLMRWLDVTKLTEYAPITLDRTTGTDSPFEDLPKQTLIYLPLQGELTGENYVYQVAGIDTPTDSDDDFSCETFKIYDDVNGTQTGFTGDDYMWAYWNKYKFTALTLTNTRRMTAGQHFTTCLPYPLAIPSGVKAYTLESASTTLVGFLQVTTDLEAFKPYVLIPSSSGNLLSAENVEVPVFTTADSDADALNPASETSGNFSLFGTMRYVSGATANVADVYIMQKGNTWMKITAEAAGYSTSATNNACILPMRAYIKSGTTGLARPHLSATFNDADGTTFVKDLHLDSDDSQSQELYDLQGRRVANPVKGGIYIRNGKKIVIR